MRVYVNFFFLKRAPVLLRTCKIIWTQISDSSLTLLSHIHENISYFFFMLIYITPTGKANTCQIFYFQKHQHNIQKQLSRWQKLCVVISLHCLHSINLCNWLRTKSSSESQESILSHAVSQLFSYICISDPLTCTTNNFLAAYNLKSTELQTYTGTWGGGGPPFCNQRKEKGEKM